MKQLTQVFISFIIVYFPGLSFSAEQSVHPRSYNREVLKQKQQITRQNQIFNRFEGRRDKRYKGSNYIWIGSDEAFEERYLLNKENEQLWAGFTQLVEENSQLLEAVRNTTSQENDLLGPSVIEELKNTGSEASYLIDSLKDLYKEWESSNRTLKLNTMLEEENRIINEYNSLIETANEVVLSAFPVLEFSYSSTGR